MARWAWFLIIIQISSIWRLIRVWVLFLFFVSLLLNLDPKIVTICRSLDHLKDSVLDLDNLLRHKNVTRVRTRHCFLAKRPASAFDRRLNTVIVTCAVERDRAAETLTITLPIVILIIYHAAWLLAWKVVAQLIAVRFNLYKVLLRISSDLLRHKVLFFHHYHLLLVLDFFFDNFFVHWTL